MIPRSFMKQTVWIPTYQVDDAGKVLKDRYGDPLPASLTDQPARVEKKIGTIKRANGVIIDVNTVIHMPANTGISQGMDIEYTDKQGIRRKGTVEGIEEAENISGTRSYYDILKVQQHG